LMLYYDAFHLAPLIDFFLLFLLIAAFWQAESR